MVLHVIFTDCYRVLPITTGIYIGNNGEFKEPLC